MMSWYMMHRSGIFSLAGSSSVGRNSGTASPWDRERQRSPVAYAVRDDDAAIRPVLTSSTAASASSLRSSSQAHLGTGRVARALLPQPVCRPRSYRPTLPQGDDPLERNKRLRQGGDGGYLHLVA